ncbi:hypothetical protein S40285_04187 [Stachybotrys chlorohalonatus IBT 40285]|uniref:EKC/KEOPS complex subunit GON7 n=1 Tax=Stachybotrys chlorohalonatus (strain IBT 40285) TaxID=1283841 RepID=A0A084QCT9_STAC4|nr:hypothetical protein S40285_04187 [Stachybotrys chlorohalonata IBT 40285]
MAEAKPPALSVAYTSSSSTPFHISHAVAAPPTSSVPDKVQYLAGLRAAVAATQDAVNKELTARMEEDKARDAASNRAAAKTMDVDEALEEQNYGEEVQSEDD